ncbi:hypothetical protein [Tatumella sp. UBA2305]|uniref:hypothetical protein n=1 Tax=Tatumella sp. UBA2305 TaxID=1947647 RepID=UPI0025D416D9|nr:hypothetical protein [Tatumella sp. UBA2305]
MSDFIALFDYDPLPLATKHPGCEEIGLLVLAHARIITFYLYPDPTNLIEWDDLFPLFSPGVKWSFRLFFLSVNEVIRHEKDTLYGRTGSFCAETGRNRHPGEFIGRTMPMVGWMLPASDVATFAYKTTSDYNRMALGSNKTG